jgi:hypothetical protein
VVAITEFMLLLVRHLGGGTQAFLFLCEVSAHIPRIGSLAGLAKDGCKQMAAAIVYVSVKEACHAVASLHQQMIGNGVLWARQLGGEVLYFDFCF